MHIPLIQSAEGVPTQGSAAPSVSGGVVQSGDGSAEQSTETDVSALANERHEQSLEDLSTEQRSEMNELLGKLYLIATKTNELNYRYLRPLSRMVDVVEHKDTLRELYVASKAIHDLFFVVQKDSARMVEIARLIEHCFKTEHHISSDDELLREQQMSFKTVLNLAPSLRTINDELSFSLFTIEEIHRATLQKDFVICNDQMQQDITAVYQSMTRLSEVLKTIVDALNYLSHMSDKRIESSLLRTIGKDMSLERSDIDHLLILFRESRNVLSKSSISLWTTPNGKENFVHDLEQHVLPLLQKALRYDEALKSLVADADSILLQLPRSQNVSLWRQQRQVLLLAESLRVTFVKLNTQTIPGLIRSLSTDVDHNQIDSSIAKIITVFKAFEQRIQAVHDIINLVSSSQPVSATNGVLGDSVND